jgi:hypothetical protein
LANLFEKKQPQTHMGYLTDQMIKNLNEKPAEHEKKPVGECRL